MRHSPAPKKRVPAESAKPSARENLPTHEPSGDWWIHRGGCGIQSPDKTAALETIAATVG